MNLEELKSAVCEAVDRLGSDIVRVSREIHAHPELAFEEHQAADLLTGVLEKAGLVVKRGAYGLPTAFEAEVTSERGASVALLAEYDALPEIGHSCGHNIIASAALGAGLALHTLADRLPGRIRILGTPAEEKGAGKELMAREGAFEGVDAALMIHPAGVNLVTMPSLAVAEVEVRYRGEAAHASAMPQRGINALDALVVAYQAIAALRQHIQSTERIHGIVTDGGQAPNIVPERSAGLFYVRAADRTDLEALKLRVEGCFRAGAEATGATVEIAWGGADYLDIRRNEPLEGAFQRNAESLGRTFFPYDKLPASVAGSTDMGNVSHRVPSIHPMVAAAPIHCTIHNAEFARWAGSETGDQAALDGAKALAMTAIDVLCDDDLRRGASQAFDALGPAIG
ncbi:MAG: M20 family metallopeptidase [Myxococcota bacterium]